MSTACEAIERINEPRFMIRKYDDNDNIFESSANTASAVTSSSTSTKLNQNNYYNEYREGILEIANSFLKMLLNQMVDNTMIAAAVKADVK